MFEEVWAFYLFQPSFPLEGRSHDLLKKDASFTAVNYYFGFSCSLSLYDKKK